ncbi:MAG: DUF429 domain-containing protein [Hyphomicrobiaceae bacterium]|nr:DUF429 domain-containing protein [Hyphomicrobiaceae bacterium]
MKRLVAGVDGARGGYVVVTARLGHPASAEVRLVADFASVLALDPLPEAIAVDMPIGLPTVGTPGGRACDRAARAVLGQRQSSLFAVPSRRAVACLDYRDACAVALATSDPPRKVSMQAFNLFPKMREIDALMTPALQARVFECHPEVAFVTLNGGNALGEPKKVRSAPYAPGLALRQGLLEAAGFPRRLFEPGLIARSAATPDDILDAAVNAWAAARIARGEATCFPDEPERDERGLVMAIHA